MKFLKTGSNARIFSPSQQKVIGKFSNGVFETDDADIIKELTGKYATDTAVVPKEVEEVEEVEESTGLGEYDVEKIKSMKMPQLVQLAKDVEENAGDLYTFGMKKAELVDNLVKALIG